MQPTEAVGAALAAAPGQGDERQAEEGCWYYQEPTTKQPAGPWTVAQLCARWSRNQLDGCTEVWREGLAGGWQPLSKVQELKAALREAAVLPGKADEDIAADGGGSSPPPAPRRVPMDEVSLMHTYTSDQGVLYVFDTVDEDWKASDVYEALLSDEAAEAAAAAPKASGSDGGIAVGTEDDPMQELLAETVGLGSTLLVGGGPKNSRGGKKASAAAAASAAEAASAFTAAAEAAAKETADIDANCDEETKLKRQKRREYRERKKLKRQAGVFVKAHENPNVYVSGLPPDVTMEEMEALFKRAGVLKTDLDTGDTKIRIYEDVEGIGCKGDALVTYAHPASVELAVTFLHEHEIRPKCRICVQQADFEDIEKTVKLSKEELVKLAAARKGDRSKYIAAKNAQKEAVSWSGEMDDGTGRRIIVLKKMFSPEEAASEGPTFYKDLAVEIAEECANIGQVLKVTPIERSKQGLVCVKFKTSSEAEECIRVMDGRFFAGRTVEASFYDGKSDLRALGVAAPSSTPPASASAAAASASKSPAAAAAAAGAAAAAAAPGAAAAATAAVAEAVTAATALAPAATAASGPASGPASGLASSPASGPAGGPAGRTASGSAGAAEAQAAGGKAWEDWLDNQSSGSDEEFAIKTEA